MFTSRGRSTEDLGIPLLRFGNAFRNVARLCAIQPHRRCASVRTRGSIVPMGPNDSLLGAHMS